MTQTDRLEAAAEAVCTAAGKCAEAGLHEKAKALRTLADRLFRAAVRQVEKDYANGR